MRRILMLLTVALVMAAMMVAMAMPAFAERTCSQPTSTTLVCTGGTGFGGGNGGFGGKFAINEASGDFTISGGGGQQGGGGGGRCTGNFYGGEEECKGGLGL